MTDRTRESPDPAGHARPARADGPGRGRPKSPVLGLDLKGGLEVVLKAVPNDPKNPPTDAQINQAISIIRSRVDKLGVSEPEIRKEAGNQVSIALAGIKDPKAAASIIGSTGQLYMLDYDRHARADRLEERERHGHLPPDRSTRCSRPPRTGPNTHPYDGRDARAVVRVRQEDAQARAQQHRPAVPARRLEEAADRRDLKTQAKTAVLLRAPAGTIWADDPVTGTNGAADAAPLRDVPHAERQEHGRLRARRARTRSPTTTRRAAPT